MDVYGIVMYCVYLCMAVNKASILLQEARDDTWRSGIHNDRQVMLLRRVSEHGRQQQKLKMNEHVDEPRSS